MIVKVFLELIKDTNNTSIRNTLEIVGALYGVWSLQRHIPSLCQGNMTHNGITHIGIVLGNYMLSHHIGVIHSSILQYCSMVLPYAMTQVFILIL